MSGYYQSYNPYGTNEFIKCSVLHRGTSYNQLCHQQGQENGDQLVDDIFDDDNDDDMLLEASNRVTPGGGDGDDASSDDEASIGNIKKRYSQMIQDEDSRGE